MQLCIYLLIKIIKLYTYIFFTYHLKINSTYDYNIYYLKINVLKGYFFLLYALCLFGENKVLYLNNKYIHYL